MFMLKKTKTTVIIYFKRNLDQRLSSLFSKIQILILLLNISLDLFITQ